MQFLRVLLRRCAAPARGCVPAQRHTQRTARVANMAPHWTGLLAALLCIWGNNYSLLTHYVYSNSAPVNLFDDVLLLRRATSVTGAMSAGAARVRGDCGNATQLSVQLDTLLAEYERETPPATTLRLTLTLDVRHATIDDSRATMRLLADLKMVTAPPSFLLATYQNILRRTM
ncbi:hypothetical protein HF086_007232 [Spodoptera exigua]|uniref:Uncharacterized protein n=1 Tax=Spodoptera exigua TaxID=7107 RepID=A0A922MTK1_SPOEX|nr:hypothetical protein HF086_007232 [Spodoptera exigua]